MGDVVMIGKLILVGTPIGNLSDISERALEALRTSDFIAAEDTRVTLKLLNHFGIKNKLMSYYEHNKVEMGKVIVDKILAEDGIIQFLLLCYALKISTSISHITEYNISVLTR